jgi:hypothetical protein
MKNQKVLGEVSPASDCSSDASMIRRRLLLGLLYARGTLQTASVYRKALWMLSR